ncbi:MAG: BON domain-containing protein [Planctomycetales bacterium]|nr:BON domain-containing protein [Planctomycetales bacterium]
MRRYVFRLTFLALAALGTSVVLGNDQQIAKSIVEKLSAEKKAGHLKGFNIELNVDEGTVWLSGRVATEEQRTVALEIARRVQGVKQVVNDLSVEATPVKQAFTPVAHEIGTGVNGGEVSAPVPVPDVPQLQAVPVQPMPAQQLPVAMPAQQQPVAMPARQQPIPYAYGRSNNMVPMAYAPARTIAYNGGPGGVADGYGGAPMPISGGGATGMAAARYDHPNMPGYAWPSYASHPNYAAVTYPKQYSPTAWPYIGPFYPYPQVPLGWRRVCLEWDDGWWFLDFNAKRH